MPTKIITVSAVPPAESSGADVNKGAAINSTEFDQNLVNLRAAVDRALAALGGYTASQTPGASQIPVTGADKSMSLPGKIQITHVGELLRAVREGGTYHDWSLYQSTPSTAKGLGFWEAVANAYRLFLTEGGQVLVGFTTPNISGASLQTKDGLTFPATQVPSSDPNTLDDYEEGTFTPVISGGLTAGVGTYTTQEGTFTKIGNRTAFDITLVWTAHTGTGAMRLSGVPFVSQKTCTLAVYADGLTLGGGKQLQAILSGSTIYVRAFDPATGVMSDVTMDAAVTALRFSGSYSV